MAQFEGIPQSRATSRLQPHGFGKGSKGSFIFADGHVEHVFLEDTVEGGFDLRTPSYNKNEAANGYWDCFTAQAP